MQSSTVAESRDAMAMVFDPHAGLLRRTARWLVVLVLVALLALTYVAALALSAAPSGELPLMAPRACPGSTCPAGIES